ncbi:WD-repeat protein [Pochonia chlamydosporia 170]|uniref:WD-repeat protein n=1 Tax=Pochonia chlamydosporia 170 TaxID=1380566 RepID=A0A179G4X2_METCM|nr:WD-repeat protein [Pochonia chlamydosporia 170]OAQ72892.1 WD-repeat protein [Pochonia chlamydosporia 170]
MKWYCALTDHVSVLRDDYTRHQDGVSGLPEGLEDAILTLYREVLMYQIKSVCSYYNNQGINFARNLLRMDDWHGLLRAVMNAEQTLQTNLTNCHYVYMEDAVDKMSDVMDKIADEAKNMKDLLGDISLNLGQYVTKMMSDNKADECLQSFYVMNPTADKDNIENRKGGLLDGISDWIFETKEHKEFINWATPLVDNPAPRLMWIRGEPGTGKTMLLMTIINKFSSNPPSLSPGVCYFFCQGIEKDLRDATTTLRCLVWQLLIQQPDLITHVQEIHRREGSAAFQGSSAFFAISNAFKSMLKDENLRPMYFVVDALDECKQSVADLRNFILDSLKICSRVKWLVSSRPSIQLQTSHVIHLDKDRLTVPVATFIRHKLSTLKEREGYNDNILTEIKREVSEKAENTFLWVALALAQLDEHDHSGYAWHGAKALEIIRAMPSGLTELYDHILERIESEYDADECKQLLAAAAFAYRPLTLSDLDLFDVPEEMHKRIIKKCSSFLTLTDKTLYPVHQSAKEYLDRTFKSKLQPDRTVPEKHWDIGRRSIEKMSSILNKRNIYEIEFGTEAKDIKLQDPDPLQPVKYACVFWADHICLGNDNSEDFKKALADDGMIHVFLKERLLFWLESLALMGQLPKGLSSIRELNRFVQIYNPKGGLATSLDDIVRFVSSHITIIRRVPLQAYGAALVFSPRSSEVLESHCSKRLPFIEKSKGTTDHWDEHLQTLEIRAGWVWDVQFLQDGMTLCSVSPGMISLWDVNTWTLKKTLEIEHEKEDLLRLSLSKDGRYLLVASWVRPVEVWDTHTWVQERLLDSQSGGVHVLAFSPDGLTLAIDAEKGIELWDVRTWTLKQVHENPRTASPAMAFSSDSKLLATGSSTTYGVVVVWDANTGEILETLVHEQDRRKGSITSVAFSPDGTTLAAGTFKQIIMLWDAKNWSYKWTLEGHGREVNLLQYFKDGSMLASGSHDSTIRIWDVKTGTLQRIFRGHENLVLGLTLSPDNKMLASGSFDGTVRIWDTNTAKGLSPVQNDWGENWLSFWFSQKIAFSNDGTLLASASNSTILRIWDAQEAICLHSLEGHDNMIQAVAFSSDDTILASGGEDRYIMLWDTDRLSHRKITGPRIRSVADLAFSPNGAILASADNGEVQLWDTTTGTLLRLLPAVWGLRSLEFFSNDMLLGTNGSLSSGKCCVHFWNIGTEAHSQEGIDVEEEFTSFRYHFPSRTPFPNANMLMSRTGSAPLSAFATELGQNADQAPPQYNLHFHDDGWMILDNQKILWLPPDYRVTAVAIYDNRIVLGHVSDELTFLTLRLPTADSKKNKVF